MHRFILSFSLLVLLAPLVAAQAPLPAGAPHQAATALKGADVQAPPAVLQPPAETPPLTEAETLEKRGDLHMARKEYGLAAETYLKAIRAHRQRDAVLHNKLGIAFHQQMDLDRAKRYYETAIKIDKRYAEAINNLGTVYYGKKKHKSAIKQYKKALEINPNSASVYSNLGTAFFARKKWEDAVQAYVQAIRLDPMVFEHRSSYGTLLQERSIHDRAHYHFFLAKTYALTGELDRALDYLRKAIEEGFQVKPKAMTADPAFEQLILTEGYAQLMANPPTQIAR